ncbi:hypothetical protein NKG94_40895 [Micromonospora sp. M12]
MPEAEVRDVLIRDADAMIVRLGGAASKAGVKANDGDSVRAPGGSVAMPPGSRPVASSDPTRPFPTLRRREGPLSVVRRCP